jgi:hypothetical protein
MRTIAIRLLLFSFVLLVFSHGAFAQIGVGISVNFGPPALPVYEQPICPGDGYLWTPGYWAYDDEDGYYWVPGTWVEAPQVGFLWTPAYWGWGGSAFLFHEGYWGPEVGFYGGINYGFGYGGVGYEGGRWEGGHFSYNTYVNHVNTTIIHNTYNTRVTNVSETHVSYNGGTGGVEARPTARQESYANQHHVGPVGAQTQHVRAARSNPELPPTRASRPSRLRPNPGISKLALWPPDKQAVNTRLLRRTRHAAMKRVLQMKRIPARKVAQKILRKLGPTPQITPANCSRTNSRRQTRATPQPTRSISSNRTSSLPSRRRITKDSSSSRKKNTSKPPRKTTTTRKNSRWSSATLNKRNSLSKGIPRSRSRWSSAKRRAKLHQSRRAVLARKSRTKREGALQNQHLNKRGWRRLRLIGVGPDSCCTGKVGSTGTYSPRQAPPGPQCS